MSSYLPNITDQIPELPLYHPDLGFFQSQMQLANSKYEQGFSQTKSAYDSILSAPLSDNSNIEARDTYLRQAQDKLKNLSSVDLSVPNNVDAANNVFAPFWQDQMMMKDASYTRTANQEMQKAFSLRDSNDPEQKSQYSDEAVQYIQNGLQKLQGANRDPNAYANLDQRRFIPSVDVADHLNKQLKVQDFKVQWDEQRGMMMIHHTNGEATTQSFQQFALANESPQMRDMFRMQGIVSKEQSIKQAKAIHPGINDDQALGLVANDMAGEYRANYDHLVNNLNVALSSNNKSIADFEQVATKNGGLNEAQKSQYNQLKDYSLQLQNQISLKKAEYTDPNSNYNTDQRSMIDGITKNPDQAFYNLASSRNINNWASAAAHNEKQETILNPIWAETAKEAYEHAGLTIQQGQLNISQQHLGIDQYNSQTERLKANIEAQKSGFSIDASGNLVAAPGSSFGSQYTPGHVTGAGTTDVTKIGSALDVFNQRQAERYADSNEGILSVPGMGRALIGLNAGKLGAVSQEDVVNYFSAAKRQLQGDTSPMSSDERLSKSRIDQALQTATGTQITDANSLRDAVIKYGKQYIGGKSGNGGTGLTPEDQQSLFIYNNAVTERTQALAYDARKAQLMKKALTESNDPDLKKLTITRSNGQKDLVNSNDVLPYLKGSYELTNATTGQTEHIPASKLASAYLQGEVSYGADPDTGGSSGRLTINGNNYLENNLVRDSRGLLVPKQTSLAGDLYHLQNRFGMSEDIQGLIKRVQASVIPNIGEYSSKTGAFGVNTNYDIDDPKSKDGSSIGTKLVQEIANPANQSGQIYVDGEPTKDDNIIKAVNSLSSMGNSDLKKFVSGVTHGSIGADGQPTIKIQFSPVTAANKTEIGDVKLGDLANKTIEIPISPNATGATLQALPRNSGHYIYQSILDGKKLESDPMLQAAGFHYTIQPDNTKNPRQVFVTIDRKVYNPQTKSYEPQQSKSVFDLYGPNAKTPDEIESQVNGLFSVHVQQNQQNQQISINNDKQSNQLYPISDINKERNK